MGLNSAKERLSAHAEDWETSDGGSYLLVVNGLAWLWSRNRKPIDRDSVPFSVQRTLTARLHPDRECSVCRSVHGSETVHPCE